MKDTDYSIVIFNIVMILTFILSITIIVFVTYDIFFIRPLAADTANDYCVTLGFDQHKTFVRLGVFSKVPVAIKCEYAE